MGNEYRGEEMLNLMKTGCEKIYFLTISIGQGF